jgi:hypothetical protein
MENSKLEIMIYQIMDDSMLKENRSDGSGWEWGWADWQRDWMDATPNRFAYRCLPLTIANQTGWWIRNPVGFTATWRGSSAPGTIDFRFDVAGETWKSWINSQFGEGIVTWNTPFLFQTRPVGSRLLVCGPINYFKAFAHPLTALIESDWMTMSFTMNWKLMVPDQPVRFEFGEPLFQAIPLVGNVCADLEGSSVTYQRLIEAPEVFEAYQAWNQGRREFHVQKARGEVKPDDWQKDYFQGRDALGRSSATVHMTKVRAPRVRYKGASESRASTDGHQAVGLMDAPGEASARESVPSPRPQVTSSARLETMQQHKGGGRSDGGTAAAITPEEPAITTGSATDTPGGGASSNGHPRPESSSNGGAVTVIVPVNDDWRRWIAENLMLEQGADGLVEAMVASGIGRADAIREVSLALESPYLRGSELLRNRLRKRDWLIATYRKINRLHPLSGEIDRRHKLRREDFLCNYYSTNRPVIITGMMDDWPAMRKWNLDYFNERFGDREIEVQMGRNAGANYEIEREKFLSRIRFSAYVEMVRTATGTNDFYLTANNNSSNKRALPELWDDVVQIPEYLDGSDRFGGFFWFGPPGTITPFHHDLTNNFMAQVIGRKRVKIAPSWDMPLMRNDFHVFSRVDGRVVPPSPHPDPDEPQIIECILNPGEILFLPIGCLHFVEGIDISVTMSFTNFVFDNDFSSFYSTYHHV